VDEFGAEGGQGVHLEHAHGAGTAAHLAGDLLGGYQGFRGGRRGGLTSRREVTAMIVTMARKQPFSLGYDQAVKGHLRAIEANYHSLIRTTIEEQLRFEPETETRNRKPLQQPGTFGATWELRFGPDNRFRVLDAVDHEGREVQIQAIGVKEGNRLTIGGEEVEL